MKTVLDLFLMVLMIEMLQNGLFKLIHKFHVMGQIEGLNILTNSQFWNEFTWKERPLKMCNLKPKIFENNLLGEQRDPRLYTEFVRKTLCLTKNAENFCTNTNFVSTKVIVKNVSFKVKQHEFWQFFEEFGKVLRATIVKDRKTRRSRGFGFVVFTNPMNAEKVLKLRRNKLCLKGRYMQVLPANRSKVSSMYSARKNLAECISEYFEDEKSV